MDGSTLEQDLLEQGKGPALVAALGAVEQSTTPEGDPRYRQNILRELGRNIVCRSYASGLLELCHLAAMLDGLGLMIEDLVWGGESPRAYIGPLRDAGAVSVTGQGVSGTYEDGQFTISFGRMTYLSALSEFLIGTIGYDAVTKGFDSFRKSNPTSKTIGDAANELSRSLYAFLGDQLPPVQDMRKVNDIVSHLKDQGGGDFSLDHINDQLVFDFWRDKAMDAGKGGGDWRTFQAVYLAFVRFLVAMNRAVSRSALDRAQPIGLDRDQGEVDPAMIETALEDFGGDAPETPLDILFRDPAADIKMLNKKEAQILTLLVESGPAVQRLPLSYLRVEVFGLLQNKITQALRRKLDDKALASLIATGLEQDYIGWIAGLRDVTEHLSSVLDAAFYVLVECRQAEALSILAHRAPDMDTGALRSFFFADELPEDDTVVAFPSTNGSDHFIRSLEQADQSGSVIAPLLADAKKAFKRINRQGFEEAKMEERKEAFSAAVPGLIGIEAMVIRHMDTLSKVLTPDGMATFDADRQAFADQFHGLYGATHG